jgi:LPS-assembly protein
MRMTIGTHFLTLICALPLLAQQAEVLPAPGIVPSVEKIEPVPPPEIPFGQPDAPAPSLPKDVVISNLGGKMTYDAPSGELRYESAVRVTTDNGTTLSANKAIGNTKTKIIDLTGMVKMKTDTGIEIFADRALIDTNVKTVNLMGHVSVYQKNILQRGEQAVYDYGKRSLDASGLRASIDPLLLEAGKFSLETDAAGKQVYVGEDAGITTNDVEEPNYWIRAARTTVYPDNKVVFNDLKFYAGGVPVFWLPYLSQPLNKELGYHFEPGSRSNWGPYLLNTYGIMLGGERDAKTGEAKDQWLLSQWHFDIRSSRGIGTGVDLSDTREEENPNLTGLKLYYLSDLDPSIQRSGIPRSKISKDRYSAQLRYRVPYDMPDHAAWRFDANLTLLSDPYYLEDFDPKVFRTDPFPDNTLGIYRNDGGTLTSLFTRLRVNDFYRSDSRLPELALDQARAPIFDLPILHEGSSSLGSYSETTSDLTRNAIIIPLLTLAAGDPRVPGLLAQLAPYERLLIERIRALPAGNATIPALTTQLLDPAFSRFHSYHEFSLPLNLGGWLSLVPEAGFGYSKYWNVAGPQESINRTYVQAGAEASVKFSKDFGEYQDRTLGLDGLVHVLQPYARWSLVSTNDLDPTFPEIDRLSFSTRPRTLDVGRFTAIDDIRDWNIVRFGARNRLLTHRDGQSYEWLYVDTYMDAFIQDPEANRKLSNLYNDVRWRPLPWLSVDLETQFPLASSGSGFSEYSARLRFQPNENFEFSIGDRFLNNHPVLTDSNRLDLRGYARINEQWGFGMFQLWELNDSTLEVEQYSLHRDLGNWVAGLGFTHRNNRVNDEYGVVLSLTLKDFPAASLPFEVNKE